jgi:hypothetical protein
MFIELDMPELLDKAAKAFAIAKLPVHHCIIGLIPFSVRQA